MQPFNYSEARGMVNRKVVVTCISRGETKNITGKMCDASRSAVSIKLENSIVYVLAYSSIEDCKLI
jgi:hypothetical protein